MSDRDDTPKGGAQQRVPPEYPPPPEGWEELRDSARAIKALQEEQAGVAQPLSTKQRNSSRPVWNGTTKGIVVGLVVALVGGLVFQGVPAVFDADKQGAVKDAEQDVQIQRLQSDVSETKQEVKAIKGIVVRIEQKVDE